MGDCDHDEIGVGSERRQIGDCAKRNEAARLAPGLGRVLGHGRHAHAHEVGQPRHLASDQAEPDDQDRSPAELSERPAAPHPAPEIRVGLEQLAIHRCHGHEHVLGDAVVVAIDIGDEAARGHGPEREPVVPGTERLEEPQSGSAAGPLGEERTVDEHIRVDDRLGHLGARLARHRDHVDGDRQVLADRIGELGEDDDAKVRHAPIVADRATADVASGAAVGAASGRVFSVQPNRVAIPGEPAFAPATIPA